MSSHLENLRSTRAALAAMIALLAVVLVAAVLAAADHPTDQDANAGGTGETEWKGDWVVGTGDDLTYANQTILLDGNLSIDDGGRLVLRNVILVLHGAPLLPQEVLVFDGELVVTDLDGDPATEADRSVVRANDTEVHYYFQAYAGSKLTITNSLVKDCGRLYAGEGYQAGLYIATDDAQLEAVEVSNGHGGIFIDAASPVVKDCNVHDNDWIGIYVDNDATPTIEGCVIEDNARAGMKVKGQSDVVLKGCSIRGNLVQGIEVDEAYLAAYDTTMSGNTGYDLYLPYFSQVDLFNCSVSATGRTVRLENSSLTSTGGSFDIGSVELYDSVFRYQQLLTVIVTWSDSLSTPISDAAVHVEDAETRTFDLTTDADGRAVDTFLVMEYDKTTPILKTTGYNPFHVTVSYIPPDQDRFVDMRYNSATVTFQFNDIVNPTAVAPTLRDADVGVNVTLDGSACEDNVAIEEWNWSFDEYGEKVYLEGKQVSYAFKEAKVYTITLKVTDTSGRSGTASEVEFDVTVQDRTPPTAHAGMDMTVEQGTVVTLDGSNSTDNVAVVGWTWSFTYNEAPLSFTGVSIMWTFEKPGIYLVVLTVEDEAGLTATHSITVTVLDTTPPTTEVSYVPQIPGNRKLTEVLQIVFNVQDTAGGTVELHYRINDDPWEKVVGGLALNFGSDLQYGDGDYVIEYYAEDAAGNTEELMTIASFTVDATTPTFRQMDPPIPTLKVTTETYTISGKTEPGAVVTINSVQVAVAADGSFSSTYDLVVGDNTFFLIAEDSVGNTDSLNIVITRERYDTNGGGDGGGNLAVYVGAVVVIVVLLLVILYFALMRRKDEGREA